MGSGLIYAAIIVMWALYFIPRWLRRHDELSESRSVEKFDHAMRILSRRDATPDQRYIVMPRKPEPAATVRPARGRRSAVARATPATRKVTAMAVRRRRVLAGLVLLTMAVATAVPFTPVPWWAPVALLVLVLADLVHLRLQERRRREHTRSRQATRKRSRSRLRRFDSAERLAEARRLLAERRAAAEAERVSAEWAAHEAARRQDEGWQPTPVPLPTYVTKPVAARASQPIDLTHPGKWTETQVGTAALAGDAAAMGEPFDQTAEGRVPEQTSATAASYQDYVNELEEILERRRAVND